MRKTQFLIFALLLSTLSFSQKVGLVLSGGGAKGAAHVGVIKALEENNIPIDYITGTSFGALVGGLYASGYTPTEMEELLKSDDFLSWAYGEINEADQYYYKKGDPNPTWIKLKLERNHNPLKTILPSSIFENHQMDLRLMEIYAKPSAAANYNFDNLMVPFRCVATDVYSSKAKVFANGDLVQALRASITFPLVFQPIKINDTVYMDGGMKNNFPSDVMQKDFNPGVIIGSKVAFNSTMPDTDDLFSQIENIFTENTDFYMPDSSLLIKPEVQEYNVYDFDLIDTLINLGYEATIQKIDNIKEKVNARRSQNVLIEKRNEFRQKQPDLIFEKVYITGVNDRQKQYVERQVKANQDTFSFDDFKKEYFRVLSDNKIRQIYPRAVYNLATKHFDLYLDVKKDYRMEVTLGGQINTTSKNFAFIGAHYKHFSKRGYDLIGTLYYGRMYSSLRVKGAVEFPYFRNNKGRRLFPLYFDAIVNYARRDYFNSTKEWFFEDATPSYITRSDTYFQLNGGIPLMTNGFFSIGGTVGSSTDNYYQTNLIKREDEPDQTRFDYVSAHVDYEYNTLNRKQFATKGMQVQFNYNFVTGTEEYYPGSTAINTGLVYEEKLHQYNELELVVKNYHNVTKRLTIGADARIQYSQKKFFNNYISTQLAGDEFKPFPHAILFYLPNFRNYSYASLGITPVVNITESLHFRVSGYVYQPYRDINYELYRAVYAQPFKNRYYIGNSSLVYSTFMGPVYLSLSYLDRNNNPWFVHFGFGFLLMNPRGLD